MLEFEPIVGRFFTVSIDGAEHRVYVEEAGKGLPLLCLHTAGADSRQYRHLLNDPAVTGRFRVIGKHRGAGKGKSRHKKDTKTNHFHINFYVAP